MDRSNHEEAAELAGGKSKLYRLLARIFGSEPTPELLRQIRTPGFMESISEIGVSFHRKFLDDPEDELAQELTLEYTRLFLGPGGHISPHESVQQGEGQLWGRSTVEVNKYYQRCGFYLDKNYKGIPDHIGVEFELISRLAEEEADKWKERDHESALKFRQLQVDFLENHLKKWLPLFCDKVMEGAENTFYASFASLAKIVVLSDAEKIQ